MKKDLLPLVLIISDQRRTKRLIKNFLSEQFQIIEEDACIGALSSIKLYNFEYIIIDSHISSCNPLKLCRDIKKNLIEDIPVLLITGRLKKSYLYKANQAGIIGFINDISNKQELLESTENAKKNIASKKKIRLTIQPQMNYSRLIRNKTLLNQMALSFFEKAKKLNSAINLLVINIGDYQKIVKFIGPISLEKLMLSICEKIQKLLRPKDFLLPSSDGKFVILTKDLSNSHVEKLAKKLQQELSDIVFSIQNKNYSFEISIVLMQIQPSVFKTFSISHEFDKIIMNAMRSLHTKKKTNSIYWLEYEE